MIDFTIKEFFCEPKILHDGQDYLTKKIDTTNNILLRKNLARQARFFNDKFGATDKILLLPEFTGISLFDNISFLKVNKK